MDCFRLRSHDSSPPGGFTYEQTVGVYKKFAAQPLIDALARMVSDFRHANNLPRPSVQETIQDVDHYKCAQLGNNPAFCVACDGSGRVALNATSPMVAKPCGGCGAPVT